MSSELESVTDVRVKTWKEMRGLVITLDLNKTAVRPTMAD